VLDLGPDSAARQTVAVKNSNARVAVTDQAPGLMQVGIHDVAPEK
jgi:hypothetical protein